VIEIYTNYGSEDMQARGERKWYIWYVLKAAGDTETKEIKLAQNAVVDVDNRG